MLVGKKSPFIATKKTASAPDKYGKIFQRFGDGQSADLEHVFPKYAFSHLHIPYEI